MPTPREGESEDDFVERCIPIVINEGTAEDGSQAAAICHNMWRDNQHYSQHVVRRMVLQPIKAFRDADGKTKYRATAVRFGSEEELDWYGTFFDKNTDFALDWFKHRPWLYDHGMNDAMGVVRVGSWDDVEWTDEAVFFVGELLSHFKYRDAVEELINYQALFPSSGTLNYLIDWDWNSGYIKRWPIVEVSSTTMPAEFRMEPMAPEVRRAIRALKGGLTMPEGRKWWDNLAAKLVPHKDVEDGETPQEALPEEEPQEDNDAAMVDGPSEEDTSASMSLDQLAALVTERLGLEELTSNVQHLVETVVAIDAAVQGLTERVEQVRAAHNQLAQSKVDSVKEAMTNSRGWAENLFVASKQGELEPEGTPEVPQSRPTMSKEEVEQAGGPMGVIRQQQSHGL